LEHEEPPSQKHWNNFYSNLEDDFVPDEDHLFDQDEIDALAKMTSVAKKRKVVGTYYSSSL
jgi:hypothetical protein